MRIRKCAYPLIDIGVQVKACKAAMKAVLSVTRTLTHDPDPDSNH